MSAFGKQGRSVFLIFSFILSALSFGQVANLSETGLYKDILTKEIHPENRAYSPQYPLWTDGAAKFRWIYLPPGTQISTTVSEGTGEIVDPDHWEFPVGTKLWKEFAFPIPDGEGTKRVETRLIEKLENGQWEFSAYVWNEEETEAMLAPTAGIPDHYPTGPDTAHDIPGLFQCRQCHNRGGDVVLGFDALQLSDDRDPLAFSEPSIGEQMTLNTLIEEDLLSHVPDSLLTPPRIHAETPEGRAAMGYMHGNCGLCHNPNGNASWTDLFLRHSLDSKSEAEENAFMTAVNIPALFYQIPGMEETFRIKAKNVDQSAILYRMKQSGFDRMPPVGTELVDEKAIHQITQWVSQLTE